MRGSGLIGDAIYQELNMSFTFDKQYDDKLIINALVDKTSYQFELAHNLNLDFEDIQDALNSKQFKLVQRSPEILKIKVGFAVFEFKKVQEMTLNTLKQTMAEMSVKLKEQSIRNIALEETIRNLCEKVAQMTIKMGDFTLKNDYKDQMIKIIQISQTRWEQKLAQETKKKNQLTDNFNILKQNYQKTQKERLKQSLEQKSVNKQQEKVTSSVKEIIKKLQQKLLQNEQKNKANEVALKKAHQEKENTTQQALQLILSELHQLRQIDLDRIKKLQDKLKKLEQKQQKQHTQQKTIHQQSSKRLLNLQSTIQKLQPQLINQIKHQKEEQSLDQLQEKQQPTENQKNQQEFKKIQQEALKQEELLQQAQTQNAQYRFSSTHKHQFIILQNNNTKVSGKFGFAMVEGVIFEKGSSIMFRIESTGLLVNIGFGIRNIIARNKYEIKSINEIGHGCFLVLNIDYMQNNVSTKFSSFSEGDLIVVSRNGDELVWNNLTNDNELRMKVQLTADEWSQMCFCVFMSGAKRNMKTLRIRGMI